ncbi:peptidoglycan DD-metalloendopeptidase family protein [Streptomyces sp. NPDC050560]|uniref:M23 family metallopeptidase n=1 Tax=Streptomyces sp. NPDC050560 TaxID=3365630 RepID=UPI003787B54C
MRFVLHRRSPLLVLVPAALLLPLAAPVAADEGAGAEVARLYAQASAAAGRYESGRRAAADREEELRRIEADLGESRRRTAAARSGLGRVAREQYRSSGGLSAVARMLAADSPEELLRGRHMVARAGRAARRALDDGRRAERGLEKQERRAAGARRDLERRNTELAALRRGVAAKLDAARARLQDEAERSVTAGQCPGAARLEQDEPPSGQPWVAPVEDYALSAGFASAGAHWANRHTGQDFAVDVGTPVRAAAEGRVERVSCGGAFGMQIVLRHEDGYFTQYAHLSSVAVDEGERVAAGQWIGQSGSTGNSTGPHLHFEVRLTPEQGSAVDPVPWLAERGVVV